ncbi:MAG: YgiQ family radical SAM protein [Bacteroidales bacterium]|jgi:uncharacterized radical SAM protein YgiQ|nr:YgiQ family radical SAM protein [Bacteroidales bacterium]
MNFRDKDIFPIPTSRKEMQSLGWDTADIILFSGDAFIDHPSFGTAVIARVLLDNGYKVAVIPQPNWRDDLRDFKKLGEPNLFFGVNAGVMDSMINHYTANKRLRSNDAYTPGGESGRRPDYAVIIYTNILKKLFPNIPVVIGGVEASLRRFTHYDYWQDKLKPSILVESGADWLVYGMGEKPIIELAYKIAAGEDIEIIKRTQQISYLSDKADSFYVDPIVLNSYDECLTNKLAFAENFKLIESESNSWTPKHLIEPFGSKFIHVTPPFPLMDSEEIDSFYNLPFTRKPHPRYGVKTIPAYEMIKFSITTHRGCFGSCAFCTISAHQGKFVQSRSEKSIVNEAIQVSKMDNFKGYISDLGGPSANMYKMKGIDLSLCHICRRDSCIFPGICKNLDTDHKPLLDLYKEIEEVKGIKKAFIGSGIRYDLFLNDEGFRDDTGKKYLSEVVKHHTSGWFKVAPEHTEDHVLKAMGKPSFKLFNVLKREFDTIIKKEGLKYLIVPYFISSHPACRLEDMKMLSENPNLKNISLEQVQDFTPTPMTRSSVSFYTGLDPKTLKKIFVEKDPSMKQKQKSLFFNKK